VSHDLSVLSCHDCSLFSKAISSSHCCDGHSQMHVLSASWHECSSFDFQVD
jgi:hypothetical protein